MATKTNPRTGRKIEREKESEGHITTSGRLGLQKKQFALPASATEKGKASGAKGSYPIDTAARARNALSRVAQHGTAAQQATVRRKVKAKYPDIEVEGKGKKGK